MSRAEAILAQKVRLDAERIGAELQMFGRTLATRLPAEPEIAPYNKARGLSEDDVDRLDEIVAFFRDGPVTIEIDDQAQTDVLGLELARRGLRPAVQSVVLVGAPTEGDAGMTIVEDHPAYVDVLLQGYALPAAHGRLIALEQLTPGLRRYVALLDGRPVAAAGLLVEGRTALFSGAATLPDARGRGAQGALVRRRLADARACADLAVVTAALGSASHRNLERHGFRVAHTRTSWTRG